MRFREGDIVRISKQSEYYGYSKNNPKDRNGRITRMDTTYDYLIRVEWDNGEYNWYREKDLALYRRGE